MAEETNNAPLLELPAPKDDKFKQDMESKAKAERIIRAYDKQITEQINFRTKWQECADYVLTNRGQIMSKTTPGEDKTIGLFDTTAVGAAEVCAAGLVSQITPAGEKWARYTAPTDAPDGAQEWLDECTDRIMEIIHSGNFYTAWHEDCLDSSVFGSSLLYIDEKPDGANFVSIPVGSFTWEENSDGYVDDVAREFEWTADQAAQRWGMDNLPKEMREILENKEREDCNKKFKFIHKVCKRRDHEKGVTVAEKRPYSSIYVCRDFPAVLEEGGYYEMPYCAGRFKKANFEKYGRSPAIDSMPEIKMLNRMEKVQIMSAEKMVNPPWLMPEDSAYRPDNRPGAIVYWDSSDLRNKPEQLDLKNRLDIGEEKAEQKRESIRSAFYVDMFQSLNSPALKAKEMTAFEVEQRMQEKLVLFSPVFSRLVTEKVTPILIRLFGICARNDLLPEPPETLLEGDEINFMVQYVSRIALAMKASNNKSLASTLQMVGALQTFDPNVAKIFRWQKAARDVARSHGLPADYMRSETEVNELIEEEAKAAEQQAAADAALQASQAAKNLGPEAQKRVSDNLPQQ